jgi:hypothetical protein
VPEWLTFFHTSSAHIQTFDRLLNEMDAPPPVRHRVHESLLQDAVEAGRVTPDMEEKVREHLREGGPDAGVVLCTCSTIGDCAEKAGRALGMTVIRVDRPMAEAAVRAGSRILLAATLASTLAPTRDLLLEVACREGREIRLVERVWDDLWERFERGDHAGYLQGIALEVRKLESTVDVVVLAQASMAGAEQYCADLAVPVLSSPRLGLNAALKAWNERAKKPNSSKGAERV